MRTVILNVGVGGWHPRGSERLGKSIQEIHPELWESGSIEFLSLTTSYPPNSPTHEQAPYGFKPYAFQWAIENNYDIAIWMDSSMWLKKSIQPIIDIIKEKGYFLLRNGFTSGEWCCDDQLEPLEITREESFTIPHLIAGLMGFNLKDELSLEFLQRWLKSVPHFLGEWTNTGKCSSDARVLGSRHDQTFASVISHKLGMEWQDPQGYFDYDINKDAIVVAQGM